MKLGVNSGKVSCPTFLRALHESKVDQELFSVPLYVPAFISLLVFNASQSGGEFQKYYAVSFRNFGQ
jgi:hypothetical protein